jgi:hypothetical protein
MLGDLVNMQRPRKRGVNNRAPVNQRLSTFPGSSHLTGKPGGGDWHLPALAGAGPNDTPDPLPGQLRRARLPDTARVANLGWVTRGRRHRDGSHALGPQVT